MSIVSYKCPRCGGGMKYDPDVGFKCEYCLSVSTQEELDAYYASQAAEETEGKPQEGAQQAAAQTDSAAASSEGTTGEAALYSCPNCGAEIIAEETTAATTCHYCHNPVVLSEKLGGKFNPDLVIPFSISKEEAAERFRQHCSGKFYLPKDFYSEDSIENLYGVYYPYWIVDSTVNGRYTARGKVVRSTRRGDDRMVETTIYDIERSGIVEMENITNCALRNADSTILRYVLPFDPKGFVDFSMSYLSGFRAEKRDMEKSDLVQIVERQKQDYTRTLLTRTVNGYTSIAGEKTEMDTTSETWRYALLPVWILVYKYKDTTYTYGINGQTGKSYGGLPINKTKLSIVTVILGIVVALLCLYFGFGGCI
ncbi:MAG: TFIIB-type zinc ribbon-containing protein [Ruminococcaceae bacterium]|nr:TFIIB-type zinc ribbon-containing protein [Oscillospiraceae bacterium]